MTQRRWLIVCAGLAVIVFALVIWPRRSVPIRPPPELDRSRIRYPYPELGITIDNYPKVDGSTSTQPLQMILACTLFRVGHHWFHSETDDTRRLWPGGDDFFEGKTRDDFIQEELLLGHIRHLVEPHGTSEAYANIIADRADLALLAREPSDDELALAGRRGVQLEVQPVALDAFIFLLNGRNPVSSLTIEQIRGIYAGRIVNWREVDGPDAPIRPYQRPRNSGSQELMQKLVMGQEGMIPAPDLLTGSLMSSTFLALDKDVHGIGYSVYYYHEFMSLYKDVKGCAVGGVLPTSKNILSRRYPFISEVFAVLRRSLPAEHPARRLRDWMLEPAGQSVVEESGYVAASAVGHAAQH
jgi:phosphate transport system substrate-binding protein